LRFSALWRLVFLWAVTSVSEEVAPPYLGPSQMLVATCWSSGVFDTQV